MSEIPTANFTGTDDGLFTVAEIRDLMRAEFARAQRYGYPLACLLVGIDRIEHLKDLYGLESKSIIHKAVTDLLCNVTRASDFLGCIDGDRILTVFPYTPPEGVRAMAGRMLKRSQSLSFDGDGHTLNITLSIGCSHNQGAPPPSFEALVEAAERALRKAAGSGGGRCVEEVLDNIHDWSRPDLAAPPSVQLPVMEQGVAPYPAPPAPMVAPRSWPASSSSNDGAPPADGMRSDPELMTELRALMGGELNDEDLGTGTERILLLKALRTLRQLQQAGGKDNKIDLLERRISKLSGILMETESKLRRVAAMKSSEPEGIASVYREVQGLDDEAPLASQKKELMSKIFQANLDLKRPAKG